MLRGMFQPMHILLVLVIALIFFGPGKLPALGAGLGKAIREFKKAFAGGDKQSIGSQDSEETEQTRSGNRPV